MESDRANKVINNLFISSLRVASTSSVLQGLNITHVLTICPMRPTQFPGISYKIVCISDSPTVKISEKFEECFEFINSALQAGGVVLVHCFQGVSRSATIVLAYLMTYKKMTLDRAVAFLKSKRSIISPNFGFINQLRAYERELNAYNRN
jgi:protein tyrosine phosphatase